MGVEPNDPRSPYLQIADDLRQAIKRGDYAPGDRLPPARELQERYGVATMTVQRAVELLRNEDLVYSVQGRGTFVRTDLDPDAIDLGPKGGRSELYQEVLSRLAAINDEITAMNERLTDLERFRAKFEDR